MVTENFALIEETVVTSNDKFMEDAISIESAESMFKKFIEDFKNHKSKSELKNIVNNFKETLKSWEIVVIEMCNQKVWIQTGMEEIEVKRTLDFKTRMKLLLRDKILYKGESFEKIFKISISEKVPMNIELESLSLLSSEYSKEYGVYYSITHLLDKVIPKLMKKNVENIAIYKKPDGIIAANRITSYIRNVARENSINLSSLEETVEVENFFDFISNSTFVEKTNILKEKIIYLWKNK